MRVVIVGKYPLDSARIQGGVQAAFSYLVAELSRFSGLDLHILTFDYRAPQQYILQQDGATIHLLPALPRFEFIFRNYRTYQAVLDEALTRIEPDVVHAQTTSADAYVALRSNYPTVLTVHGIQREDSKHLGDFLKRVHNRFHSARIETYSLKHTQYLIAISRYVTEYFAPIIRPETKVWYIPNAISQHFFELDDMSDGCTVLFMGCLIPRKRPLDLVRAFALLVQHIPQAQLRLAGDHQIEPKYVDSLRSYIERSGLKKHVHLLGPLPEERVLEEYARCTVLALPSVQETTPVVIAEAMAASKPVVATDVGGVAEMVDHGKTGFLLKVGDVQGLSNSLQRLLQDSTLRSEMGKAGKQKAEKNYRARIVAERTLQVYQTIAAER